MCGEVVHLGNKEIGQTIQDDFASDVLAVGSVHFLLAARRGNGSWRIQFLAISQNCARLSVGEADLGKTQGK